MYRNVINGPRTVQGGTIVQTMIPDFVEAVQIKKRLVRMNNKFSYEITGVYGDYKIIRRDLKPSSSDYVN